MPEHAVQYIALLNRAKELLENVDDWGHPWTHNAYVDQVDRFLFELVPVLLDSCNT